MGGSAPLGSRLGNAYRRAGVALALALGVLAIGVPSSPAVTTSVAAYSKTYGFADTDSVFPYGMAYDPTDNTVLTGDYWNYKVQRYSASGAHLATYRNSVGAGVGAAYDVAIDPWDTPPSGLANYWVADQEQSDMVEFDHTGHLLRTLGVDGTGSYQHAKGCGGGMLNGPTHMTIDPTNGNIYVSDVSCKNVWEYAHDGTFIRGFDWTGWKNDTGYFTPTPRGIQMDENGNIYVLELNSRTVVVFDRLGQYQRVFPRQADMNDPRGLDIDTNHDHLYAVGALKQRIFEFSYGGTLLKEWDSPTGSFNVKTDPKFNSIRSPAVDPATGNVFFGDTWGYRIYKFDSNANPLSWSSPASPPANGGYTQQTGVAVNPAGTLFVTGSFDQRVQAFDTTKDCRSKSSCAAFEFAWGTRVNPGPNATGFDYPKTMVFADSHLWIGEGDGNDIQVYNSDGSWVHRFGSQGTAVGQFKSGIQGMYVANGHVFATDVGNCRLQVFDESFVLANTSGAPISAMGGCGTGTNQMTQPRGVVADGGSTAYVLETTGGRLGVWNWQTGQKLQTYQPTCGGTRLNQPWGATWDPSHTWIYIGDKGGKRVVRWNPATLQCDVVTTGADTPEGSLSGPDFLNFGPDGKLYVSDNNKRVYSFTITG
jgi:tripartite motif-containing protein 71